MGTSLIPFQSKHAGIESATSFERGPQARDRTAGELHFRTTPAEGQTGHPPTRDRAADGSMPSQHPATTNRGEREAASRRQPLEGVSRSLETSVSGSQGHGFPRRFSPSVPRTGCTTREAHEHLTKFFVHRHQPPNSSPNCSFSSNTSQSLNSIVQMSQNQRYSVVRLYRPTAAKIATSQQPPSR